MTINKWDLRFVSLAKEIASWSKDTTKVGCCIVNGKNPISMGFNGFPAKTNDERCGENWKISYEIFNEANIIIEFIN